MAGPLSGVVASLQFDVAWAQVQGARDSQQDAAAITRWPNAFHLLVLADGMGGHAGGREASRLVVDTLRSSFDAEASAATSQRLLSAAERANQAIFERVERHPELDGMGATLLAVTFDGEAIEWLSVGDSPLWLIRGGELRRMNQNHSMAPVLDEQAARGEISVQEAQTSPLRSRLLAAVMGDDIDRVDTSAEPFPLAAGDTLILASDGLESLDIDSIAAIAGAQTAEGAAERVDRLLEAVMQLRRPRQDNATVILARVGAH